MMDWTDRHFRFLLRQVTGRALLYTEMVHVNALIHGDAGRHLDFSEEEHPVALQLGGDEPAALAEGARAAQQWGYDEVNLNVGCPSERVQRGNFGACLMADPERVREIVQAMAEATTLPVTVKHRIGIDHQDDYEFMARFVETVAAAGARRFTVHARKAWLQGLSPKENREIPPLRHEEVYRLKREFPELEIELNGGVRTLEAAQRHLDFVDAVMIGRMAYQEPYSLALADRLLFGDPRKVPTRREVVERMLPYIEARLQEGTPLGRISRHMLGLFNGCPGARAWRREISEGAHLPGAGTALIQSAMAKVPEEVLDQVPVRVHGPPADSEAADIGIADDERPGTGSSQFRHDSAGDLTPANASTPWQ